MEYSGLIILTAIIGLAWAIIRAGRKQREKFKKTLQEAGFFELSRPEKALTEKLKRILSVNGKNVTIGRIFRYSANSCDLYLITPEPSENMGRTLIVQSSRLDLPRLVLAPKFNIGGKLGQLLNRLGEHVLGRLLPRVDLENQPEFGERYFLFGEDAAKIRSLFDSREIRTLLDSDRAFYVSGQDDLFAFAAPQRDMMQQRKRRSVPEREELRAMVDHAQKLFEMLSTPRAERETAYRS